MAVVSPSASVTTLLFSKSVLACSARFTTGSLRSVFRDSLKSRSISRFTDWLGIGSPIAFLIDTVKDILPGSVLLVRSPSMLGGFPPLAGRATKLPLIVLTASDEKLSEELSGFTGIARSLGLNLRRIFDEIAL